MKKTFSALAIGGGNVTFDHILPVGQFYFPPFEEYQHAMQVIFDSEYYTNHGPYSRQLEETVENMLNVKHALYVSNATIGLYMLAVALGLKRKVIVPSFTFIASAQSLIWAGAEPLFCDVSTDDHHVSAELIENILTEDVSGILAVNLWGGSSDINAILDIGYQHNIPVYFDSAHAFGCQYDGVHIGNFGSAEVFSFHATKIISSGEGGVITTNDDDLADCIRNMRSNYGIERVFSVPLTVNGRMSEAQAAVALLNLKHFEKYRSNNYHLRSIYETQMSEIEGISIVQPSNVSMSNFQNLVCHVDETVFGLSRDELLAVLRTENVMARRYFSPGTHNFLPFSLTPAKLPHTEHLCNEVMQLPLGAFCDDEAVEKVIDIIRSAREFAYKVKKVLDQ